MLPTVSHSFVYSLFSAFYGVSSLSLVLGFLGGFFLVFWFLVVFFGFLFFLFLTVYASATVSIGKRSHLKTCSK